MYAITYKTEKGGSGVYATNNMDFLKKKVKSFFKQKLEATIYKDAEVIGKIWKDNSQRSGWNYSISK